MLRSTFKNQIWSTHKCRSKIFLYHMYIYVKYVHRFSTINQTFTEKQTFLIGLIPYLELVISIMLYNFMIICVVRNITVASWPSLKNRYQLSDVRNIKLRYKIILFWFKLKKSFTEKVLKSGYETRIKCRGKYSVQDVDHRW